MFKSLIFSASVLPMLVLAGELNSDSRVSYQTAENIVEGKLFKI